jgi:hypothetical protein
MGNLIENGLYLKTIGKSAQGWLMATFPAVAQTDQSKT